MKYVVMKFGGTSVEDAAAMQRTTAIVAGRRTLEQQPIVVVSAMAKVTDQLLLAAATAARGERESALAISERLLVRHQAVAIELGVDGGWLAQEFAALDEILRGLAAVGELTPRINDMIVSYGERLSSRIIAAAFAQQGLDGVHVDARTCIITDAQHMKAVPNDARIEEQLRKFVLPHADARRTVVMGGFIGSTEQGVTTTLGRGGSDYTGALVGAGVNAEAIEIWTDVNGIMTTDPRVVPTALRVRSISFEEAAELAYFGAKVLHPATILPAVKKNIPVLVLNSRNAANEGTRIQALAPPCRNPVKSIAAKKRLTIVDVVASRMLMTHGYMKAIFDIFDKHKCVVDMVSTSEVSVSLTVDSNEALPAITADLSMLADVKYEGRKALVCLVGEDIRGHSGTAARLFNAIKHINVRMISQGASEINMSFMIDEDDVEEAIRSLHAEFFSDPDPTIFDVEGLA
ncbi:lysine-sensitive aspartokinase 3 [Acidipila sp. EB88]|nr:lysine-sensitive aspartokinase 3 [Acidipila sp. EB88]